MMNKNLNILFFNQVVLFASIIYVVRSPDLWQWYKNLNVVVNESI